MKICVPTVGLDGLNDTVAQHFGRAASFTFIDTETDKIDIIPKGGMGPPLELIAEEGTNVVICSGLGIKAVNVLKRFGIDIFVYASGTVRGAIALWQKGLLEKATNHNVCNTDNECMQIVLNLLT